MLELMMIFNLWALGILLLIMAYKFMLMMLMMMEIVILLTSVLMYLLMGVLGLEVFMIYFLIFSVCESVLGLMILVLIIRFYGNEMYSSFNLFKFF